MKNQQKKPLKIIPYRRDKSVQDAFASARKEDLSQVIIIGYNRQGQLCEFSSQMTNERGNYMLQSAILMGLRG